MFPDVGALNKCFIFIFKGFCKVFLSKYIAKLAFSSLGWAQVYMSQLSPKCFGGFPYIGSMKK